MAPSGRTDLVIIAVLLIASVVGCKRDVASAPSPGEKTSLRRFFESYREPEIFQENDPALAIRIKLLDLLPSGSTVKIATFNFDNGESTRRLARHLCLAAQRGARAELLVDSKAGDQPGLQSPFDVDEAFKIQTELLQYLSNCGVSVYVHNHLESFIDILGTRIPNIFLDPALDGAKFGVLPGDLAKVYTRINDLLGKLDAMVQARLGDKRQGADFAPFLDGLKSLVLAYERLYQLSKKPEALEASGRVSADVEKAMSELRDAYRGLLHSPFWDKVSAGDISRLLPQLIGDYASDTEFASLQKVFRRHNRLNHRKLFWVSGADPNLQCMLLGGRNIGDDYLKRTSSHYHDGDVFLCAHQRAEAPQALRDAELSFESLKNDAGDPVLRLPFDNSIRKIEPVADFKYRALAFAPGQLPPRATQETYPGSLKYEERLLPSEGEDSDPTPIHGDVVLDRVAQWRLLKSGWEPAEDEVAIKFQESIRGERREIYIESPYADWSATIREAIASALQRGVKVQIVTNSFATSDGGSKIIRLLMEKWVSEMKSRFPKLFSFQVTTAENGHMTHFKFAAFACGSSSEATGAAYIVGSHNFHRRSGYADKEHALYFTRNEADACAKGFASADNLVAIRRRYFESFSRVTGAPALSEHSNVVEELVKSCEKPGSMATKSQRQSRVLSEAIVRMLYDFPQGQAPVMHDSARLTQVMNAIEDGGIHDLIGYVL